MIITISKTIFGVTKTVSLFCALSVLLITSCNRNSRWGNGDVMSRNVQRDESGTGNEMNSKIDNCVKTEFSWQDSKGDTFPVYMNSIGSCFIIRTSKSGEDYRAYLGEEVSEQVRGARRAKNNFPYNEVTLDDNCTYFCDVDFDGKEEKIEKGDKGEVFVYKTDNRGDYVIDVSSDIPYCWIRINLCCPAHKAYTTINYDMHTIYTEAHYGSSDCQINQYKKIGEEWIEVSPVKPLSLICED